MGLKSGNIEKFKGYSKFNTLKEFNNHMEMWMTKHKQDFTKSELIGLKALARFAAKIPGISNAKIGTVLKAIHEKYNGNGISRSTFKRMLGKAKKFGILTVLETERKNGSQSSNLYIFNPFPNVELPKDEKMDHPIKETSNLIKTKSKLYSKRKDGELDYTYTSDRVPERFVLTAKPFFNCAKTIEEYWRMAKIAFRFEEEERILDVAIKSFKQLIRALKFTRKVRKPIAYYYGILQRKEQEMFFEDLYDDGFCHSTYTTELEFKWFE